MVTCTRIISFDAAHRIIGHEGKCRFVHGHGYVAHIEVTGDIDDIGRVIDFSVIKDMVGGWIDSNWDHGIILNCADTPLGNLLCRVVPNQKVFYLPENPTAEAMAGYLFDVASFLLVDVGITVKKVTIHETQNCYATVVDKAQHEKVSN